MNQLLVINHSQMFLGWSLDWWKYKNIWKRPITQDDEKAVRMITKHLGLE